MPHTSTGHPRLRLAWLAGVTRRLDDALVTDFGDDPVRAQHPAGRAAPAAA